MPSLENVLSKSVLALEKIAQTDRFPLNEASEHEKCKQQEQLSSLLTILTGTKVALQKELGGKRAVRVSEQTIRAINKAIAVLMEGASTDSRINAVQIMLFGTNVPLWNVLKDIQQLLYTVKSLQRARGQSVAKIEGMDGGRDV